jgi:hypothetical protein
MSRRKQQGDALFLAILAVVVTLVVIAWIVQTQSTSF